MDGDDWFAIAFFGGAIAVGQVIGFWPTMVLLVGIGLLLRHFSRAR